MLQRGQKSLDGVSVDTVGASQRPKAPKARHIDLPPVAGLACSSTAGPNTLNVYPKTDFHVLRSGLGSRYFDEPKIWGMR